MLENPFTISSIKYKRYVFFIAIILFPFFGYCQSSLNLSRGGSLNAFPNKNYSVTLTYSLKTPKNGTGFQLKFIKDRRTSFVSAQGLFNDDFRPNEIIEDTLFYFFQPNNEINLYFTVTLKLNDEFENGDDLYNSAHASYKYINCIDTIKYRYDTVKNDLDSIRAIPIDTIKCLEPFAYITSSDTLVTRVNTCNKLTMVNAELPDSLNYQWVKAIDDFYLAESEERYVEVLNNKEFVFSASNNRVPIYHKREASIYKLNTSGELLWKKVFYNPSMDYYVKRVRKVSEQSLMSFGLFNGGSVYDDTWIVKFDTSGNILWDKKYTGITFIEARIKDSNNIVVLGKIGNAIGIMTIDKDGNTKTIKTISLANFNPSFVRPSDFLIDENNYIVVANFRNDRDNQQSLIKIDTSGNIIYARDVAFDNLGFISSIAKGQNGGYILAGSYEDLNIYQCPIGSNVIWVIKTNSQGEKEWDKSYGGDTQFGENRGVQIRAFKDDKFLVIGNVTGGGGNVTDYHGGPSGGWMFELGDKGNLNWQKTVGDFGNIGDPSYGRNAISSFAIMPDNSLIGAGTFTSQNDNGGKNFIFKIGQINTIGGTVYIDENKNGIKDHLEPHVNDLLVKTKKGNINYTSTVSNGGYKIFVDTGTYFTTPILNNSFFKFVPEIAKSVFSNFSFTDSIHFGLQAIKLANDLQVSVLPISAIRPGFSSIFKIVYENSGSVPIPNTSVVFIKDHRSIFDSASVMPDLIVADTIEWQTGLLKPFEKKSFTVYLKGAVPPALNIGDSFKVQASVRPLVNDILPLNNNTTVKQLVSGSYDPNDKIEVHGNQITKEEINNQTYLNYIIRFQNTGTDTAFKVIVRDSLENKLNIETIEMMGASHPYRLLIKNNNTLEWVFDPIALPDSGINNLLSNGYIAFRIKTYQDLETGDTIKNKAAIYFDYNAPVITNLQKLAVTGNLGTICYGNNAYFSSGYPEATSYQWEINMGQGFASISINDFYNGVNSHNLTIIQPFSDWYGYHYRCKVTLANGATLYSSVFTLKFLNTWTGTVSATWENPANWSCGLLPGDNTDVYIYSGSVHSPEINSSNTVRSILLSTGAHVMVKAGVQLILKGKQRE